MLQGCRDQGIEAEPRHLPHQGRLPPNWTKVDRLGTVIMIEESTQSAEIVTADLKCITFLMTSISFSLHSCNSGHHFVSYPWIFCHFHISPFPCFSCSIIFAAEILGPGQMGSKS